MLVILILFPLLSGDPGWGHLELIWVGGHVLEEGLGWLLGPAAMPDSGSSQVSSPSPSFHLHSLSPGLLPHKQNITLTVTASPIFSAGAKAFVCDQCGAQFSKEDALETHRQTHTGE